MKYLFESEENTDKEKYKFFEEWTAVDEAKEEKSAKSTEILNSLKLPYLNLAYEIIW